MADSMRAKPSGIAADIARKLAGKRDPEAENEGLTWIFAVLGRQRPSGGFEDILRDGTVLCEVMNALKPGSVKKINKSGGNFKLMENHAAFQKAAESYGVPREDVYQTVDLWECKNLPQAAQTVFALGRTAQANGFSGPVLGPKLADKQEREWTEEQLKAGQSIPSLQMGFNKGATQSGMNIGNIRHIVD